MSCCGMSSNEWFRSDVSLETACVNCTSGSLRTREAFTEHDEGFSYFVNCTTDTAPGEARTSRASRSSAQSSRSGVSRRAAASPVSAALRSGRERCLGPHDHRLRPTELVQFLVLRLAVLHAEVPSSRTGSRTTPRSGSARHPLMRDHGHDSASNTAERGKQ